MVRLELFRRAVAATALALALIVPQTVGAQQRPPATQAAKDANADRLQATANRMEKQLKAKPNDASLRLKVAQAYDDAGRAYEFSNAPISPHMKYATALHDYNIALKYNPRLPDAAANKKQIEDIYRSMHRPIPK